MAELPPPPYIVVGSPGPGLATIIDTRDRTVGLWSRTFGKARRGGARDRDGALPCAICGTPLRGGYYRPPNRWHPIRDRLCLACVERPPPAPDEATT